jgi:hypothetical protein
MKMGKVGKTSEVLYLWSGCRSRLDVATFTFTKSSQRRSALDF